jgi:hypothetical protein
MIDLRYASAHVETQEIWYNKEPWHPQVNNSKRMDSNDSEVDEIAGKQFQRL